MRTVICLLAFIIFNCAPEKKKAERNDKPSPDGSKIVTTKHENGKTRAEIPYKDGKQHGISRSFDRNGDVILELPYVDGKREGLSKKYFAGGKKLYQTTEYKNDKLHGLQTKFRENGRVLSEARYENDFPCLGLKEYLLDNTLKKQYPQIKINPIDRLATHGQYVLEVSMSDKVRSVKYYSGKLSPAGCLVDNLYFILLDEDRKTGKLTYHLPPGGFKMEEINIIAVVETLMGNTYVTQRSYNLAIDN